MPPAGEPTAFPSLSSSSGGGVEARLCDADIDRVLLQARISGQAPVPPDASGSEPSCEDKAARVRAAPAGLFERSFHSRADVPVEDEEEHLWVLAINKWCCIFTLANEDPGSVGVQAAQCLVAEGEKARDELLRDVFGLRSPRTAIKRANALLRCLRWHQKERSVTWPWDRESVTAFVKSLGESASAVSSLFEAINFAHHVMDVPFCDDLLNDRRLQGRARRLAGEKPEVKQQEPLKVELVAKLEKTVASEALCDVDTYVLGGELFALYSRSRWSDLKKINSIWIDFARTRERKTNNTVRTKRRAMPLVAPFPGVTDANWVKAWWQAGQRLGVDWSEVPFGPLVRAPDSSGKLCKRRCTSSEAGSMLCNALGLEGESRRTSHVLKGTTLAWTGKRGFGEREGLLLGHHATGSSSLACYSRELLSAPLRAYRRMLWEVRTNIFKPDATRSGWLASQGDENLRAFRDSFLDDPKDACPFEAPTVHAPESAASGAVQGDDLDEHGELEHYRSFNRAPDSSVLGQDLDFGSWDRVDNDSASPPSVRSPLPGDRASSPDVHASNVPATPPQDAALSQASSSSSSCSSSSETSETEEQLVARCGVEQDYEINEPCWQHVKSRMLHRAQGDKSACRTRCGRRTTNVYRWLEGAYFKWTRCAVCWKGELLDSQGALANKLNELMDRT
ncbi:unnamed protein product [Symbiodinium sp. CCMP2592]|nr:unnamed protein product [Symbiodinium sp. CCMP2592]